MRHTHRCRLWLPHSIGFDNKVMATGAMLSGAALQSLLLLPVAEGSIYALLAVPVG